ncbi:hypothetical protein ACQZV8_17670 [Magnetococcales bacterium HHB-1]
MKSTFCDGVANIAIKSGVIRVDFFEHDVKSTEEQNEETTPPTPHQRLLLTPEAFLQTHAAFEQVVQQLVDRGVFKRKETENS